MAETAEIARIAEKIADEIFVEFLWRKVGPLNQNWNCEKTSAHGVTTHPSDVVFAYDEPYSDSRTYVQCDLKSYASTSIVKTKVESAIISLCQQVACSEISDGWRDLYVSPGHNLIVVGMLFIYNHDGGFDRTFEETLEKVKLDGLDLPKANRVFVIGPTDIRWLYNVSQEIIKMRGRSHLPDRSLCSFFYPQQVLQRQLRGEQRCAATLEMLAGPWIILKYRNLRTKLEGFVVFCKNSDAGVNDYLYLLDYMRQHGMLSESFSVILRAIDSTGKTQIAFQKAQDRYVEQMGDHFKGEGSLADIVSKISFALMESLVSTFSSVQLGMDYDR